MHTKKNILEKIKTCIAIKLLVCASIAAFDIARRKYTTCYYYYYKCQIVNW